MAAPHPFSDSCVFKCSWTQEEQVTCFECPYLWKVTRLLGVGVGLVDLFDFWYTASDTVSTSTCRCQNVCMCACMCIILFFVVLAKETSLCHKLFPVGMKKLCCSLLFSKEHVEDGERRRFFLSVSVTPSFFQLLETKPALNKFTKFKLDV